MHKYEKGFSVVEGLLVLVIAGLVAGAGWYVYSSQKNAKDPLAEADKTNSSSTQEAARPEQEPSNDQTAKYLTIPEAGIKVALTANIQDAYYSVSTESYRNGQPLISLSAHSLDAYPECAASASSPGVAYIGTFKQGETDPVQGDFSNAYPEAPEIDGLFYFISGNHYDCTLQKDPNTYQSVRRELLDTYKSIEHL